MILSMTGFGRTEGIFGEKKICIDIKSLNSKSFDLNIRIPIRYKDKEFEIRKILNNHIVRGKVDCFIRIESLKCTNSIKINQEVIKYYIEQLKSVSPHASDFEYLKMAIRMPDTISNENEEDICQNEWFFFQNLLEEAIAKFSDFRKTEGYTLEKELEKNIILIENFLNQVLPFEEERIHNIKASFDNALKEFTNVDDTRLYQELSYYIEKLDISEEKVRLSQHLNYYLEVMKNEEINGKKLGFICQEIGREINTLGSKANHYEIQKLVVMMKDSLEKIKEQTLNVL